MAETPKDGGQELAEGGLPKPTFVKVSDDQQHSEAAKTGVQFDENAFLAKVQDIVKREVQSSKDQRIDKLYKQLGSDPRQIVEAIKGGQDPDKVLESLERQSLFERLDAIEQQKASPSQPSPNGKAEEDEAFSKAVSLVQKAGLANDPEVQALFKGIHKNPTDFAFAVNELVLTRNTKTQPAAASVTSPAGGRTTARNAEAIQAEIDAITGDRNKALSQDGRAELNTLAVELRQLEAQ